MIGKANSNLKKLKPDAILITHAKKNLIRKKDGKIFGHASINTQFAWCQKSGVKNAIFTHFGKQLVEKPILKQHKIVRELGEAKDVMALVAIDGFSITL